MNAQTNLLGCFVSGPTVMWDADQKTKDIAAAQGALFRDYIWGENGICKVLKILNHSDYGQDLVMVLYQFYLNPIPIELISLGKIKVYRSKEKSIGLPVIVTNENFFDRTKVERTLFLKKSILENIGLIKDVVINKKLDTNIEKLKIDLENILR